MSAARERETVFTLEATPIKFGPGAAADAGWELKRLGVDARAAGHRPGVAAARPSRPGARRASRREGIEVVVYDRARVEPTLDSFQDAADFARDADVDGFVSVGGGSSIDTAKVADLITTHPAPVMDYVNPPVGEGRKPPSPLRPHLAIPTTSGHRRRGDHGRGARHPRPEGQDRHLAPLPAPGAGDRRPRARRARCRPRSPSSAGPRRRLPRRRVLPLPALRPARRARRRPTTARPTRAPTRSPTCGRPRRSSTAGASCAARSPTPTTSRRAAR